MVAAQEHVGSAPIKRTREDYRERIGLALFWLTVLVFAYFVPEYFSWNTESHLYPAYSFVDHHTFAIDRYQDGLGDKSFWHGHYYSDKAPGLTFLAIPVYAVLHFMLGNEPGHGYVVYRGHGYYGYYLSFDMVRLRYGITFLLVILPSAALIWLLWAFMTHVTNNAKWSLLTTVIYAFGTPAFVFSQWFFSHQISAVLLFSAFLLIFWQVRGRPPNRRLYLMTACAGLLAGYSVICEYPTLVVAGLLGAYLLVTSRARLKTVAAFVAGMLPAAALSIYYNVAAFGAPFATGYMHVHSEMYHSNIHGGIGGLTNPLSYGVQLPTWNSLWQVSLGTYRGLFFYCPVLLLFIPGVVAMWRRRDLRAETWLCVAIVVIYFVVDSARGLDQNGWSGGASITSRHLVPMLPFMAVPIVFGITNRSFRIALLALGAVSVAIMTILVSLTTFFTMTDQNLLQHEALPAFFAGHVGNSWAAIWWSSLGMVGWVTWVPLLGAATVFGARIWWLLTRWARDTRAAAQPATLSGAGDERIGPVSHRADVR